MTLYAGSMNRPKRGLMSAGRSGAGCVSRRVVLFTLTISIMVLVIGYAQSAAWLGFKKDVGMQEGQSHRRKRVKPPRAYADVHDAEVKTAPATQNLLHMIKRSLDLADCWVDASTKISHASFV